MSELCVITPIGLHPRFVRVRPLHFRHDHGAIIAGREYLDRAAARLRLRALTREIKAHDRAGRGFAAVQARANRRDLELAYRELCAFSPGGGLGKRANKRSLGARAVAARECTGLAALER